MTQSGSNCYVSQTELTAHKIVANLLDLVNLAMAWRITVGVSRENRSLGVYSGHVYDDWCSLSEISP